MIAEQVRLIHQSGVVPYRVRRARLEIAMVTASSGPHWTIPKGHVEAHLTPHDSAAKEAFEEAGLLGIVDPESVGSYTYDKRGRKRLVHVYILEVTRELQKWPEMSVRKRRWMSLAAAAEQAISPALRRCILAVERHASITAK